MFVSFGALTEQLLVSKYGEAGSDVCTKAERVIVNSLPLYENINLINPLDYFKNNLPQYCILVRGDKKYLVNTEGYTYCRYIGLLKGDE